MASRRLPAGAPIRRDRCSRAYMRPAELGETGSGVVPTVLHRNQREVLEKEEHAVFSGIRFLV
jgi:hypothetical protein